LAGSLSTGRGQTKKKSVLKQRMERDVRNTNKKWEDGTPNGIKCRNSHLALKHGCAEEKLKYSKKKEKSETTHKKKRSSAKQ